MVVRTRSESSKRRKGVDFSAEEIASAVARAARYADVTDVARAKNNAKNNDVPAPAKTPWRTWQTDLDIPDRRRIIHNILCLLRAKKPELCAKSGKTLPEFVRRLEELIYRHASSKEEYTNVQTLETRLKRSAERMLAHLQ